MSYIYGASTPLLRIGKISKWVIIIILHRFCTPSLADIWICRKILRPIVSSHWSASGLRVCSLIFGLNALFLKDLIDIFAQGIEFLKWVDRVLALPSQNYFGWRLKYWKAICHFSFSNWYFCGNLPHWG